MDALTLFAPGKLFVLGEWSVLEGAPALLVEAPAGQRGVARVSGASGLSGGAGEPVFVYHAPEMLDAPRRWRWSSGRWEPLDDGPGAMDLVGETLAEAAQRLAPPVRGLELEVHTENLFVERGGRRCKLGFGSSGSVCALVASALRLASQPTWPTEVSRAPAVDFPVAHGGHRRAQQGRGSGADVAVSVYGGLIQYQLGEPPGLGAHVDDPRAQVAQVAGRGDLSITAVWTGQEADTRVLMAAMRTFEARDRRAYGAAIRGVGDAATAGLAAWRHGGVSSVLDGVRASQESLEVLGSVSGAPLVTDAQREIAAVVADLMGDKAAVKLSGAGGGDMVLVFAPPTPGLVPELCKFGYFTVPVVANP